MSDAPTVIQRRPGRRRRRPRLSLLILTSILGVMSSGSRGQPSAVVAEMEEDGSSAPQRSTELEYHDESLLRQVQEVLTDASPSLTPLIGVTTTGDTTTTTTRGRQKDERTTRGNRIRTRWKSLNDKIQNVISTAFSSSGVATMAESQTVATVAMTAVQVERELFRDDEVVILSMSPRTSRNKEDAEERRRREQRRNRIRRQRAKYQAMSRRRAATNDAMLDMETIEGARLLSASFGVIANTIGLIADGVRVSGETAAGVMGSSVKLVGTAVKSVSGNLETASRILEPMQRHNGSAAAEGGGRKPLTAQRLKERQQKRGKLNDGDFEEDHHHDGVFRNTRGVAAQSLRLVGNVIRGFGDTLVLAGSATESVAASAAGVAEGSVRIFEDFAGSISVVMTSAGRVTTQQASVETKTESATSDDNEAGHNADDHDDDSFFTYGSYDFPMEFDSVADWMSRMERRRSEKEEALLKSFLDELMSQAWEFVLFLFSDTRGVPSFAYDLLGVMILCYVLALWTLSPRDRDERQVRHGVPMLAVEIEDSESSQSGGEHTVDHLDRDLTSTPQSVVGTDTARPATNWKRMRLIPVRMLSAVITKILRGILSRQALLVVLYIFAWLYLSRASQLRSGVIQRHGEIAGFRSAIESLGRTTPTSRESLVWMNSLMEQIWRVSYDPFSEQDRKWAKGTRDYPEFVRRAIRDSLQVNPDCLWDAADRSPCLPYGGLEPYFVSKIGKYLLDTLEASKASRKNDVAYVSLYSFTLGSRPPLLRSVELLGKRDDGKYLQFDVEIDAFLEDLSLVLEVKLSSLDYALLPSTKVSIHSVDVNLPLKVSVAASPEYPFISTLEFSFAETPEFNVRITPLSRDSGLKGVDLGSLPVIREWIQEVIRETLTEYVTPKYIQLDFATWFKSGGQCTLPNELPPTTTDLSQLRKKTRAHVNPNPRTSSPQGVTISSVAESLASHKSAHGSLSVKYGHGRDGTYNQVRPIVKPKTELSRLGMDRWISKQTKNIDNVPSRKNRLADLLGRPMSLVSPFLIAIAAGVFRDRVVDDPPSDAADDEEDILLL